MALNDVYLRPFVGADGADSVRLRPDSADAASISVTPIWTFQALDPGTSSFTVPSWTPLADTWYLITVTSRSNVSGTDPPQPTLTGNGITWTAINTVLFTSTSGTTRFRTTTYKGKNASPTTGTLVIDEASQVQRYVCAACDKILGVDSTDLVVQSATNSDSTGSATALTITLAASFSSANNIAYGAFGRGTAATGTPTAGSGFTLKSDQADSSSMGLQTEANAVSTDLTVDMSWSAAGQLGGIAIELKTSVSSDVSLALTGAGSTASAGTLVSSIAQPLTTALATSSNGTLTSAVAQPLTTALATSSAGTLISALTRALVGSEPTAFAGTVIPNNAISVALSGAFATASPGTLVSAVTQPLTGSQAAGQASSPTTVNATPLTGAQATAGPGTLVSSVAQPLAGSGSTADTGTVSPVGGDGSGTSQPLTGAQATTSAGTVVPVVTGQLTGDLGLTETGTLRSAITQPVTGSQATGSAGSTVSSVSGLPAGQQATANAGQVASSITQPLTGAQGAGQPGTLVPNAAYVQALSGSFVTSSAGTLGVAVTGILSGGGLIASAGTVTPAGGDTVAETSGGSWLMHAKRRGSR